MTWNLWWRYGPWAERYDSIKATLSGVGADIIALQEVWGVGGTDLAAKLGRELGFYSEFRSRKCNDGVWFGNAILSRWPITAVDAFPLPGVVGRDELRLGICATVRAPERTLLVYSTHLNWRPDDGVIRAKQISAIQDFVSDTRAPGDSAILCGDFNAQPDSEEIALLTGSAMGDANAWCLRDAWAQAGAGDGDTISVLNPYIEARAGSNMRIDYVFVGASEQDLPGRVESCDVVGNRAMAGVWPSDHFAVVADLVL